MAAVSRILPSATNLPLAAALTRWTRRRRQTRSRTPRTSPSSAHKNPVHHQHLFTFHSLHRSSVHLRRRRRSPHQVLHRGQRRNHDGRRRRRVVPEDRRVDVAILGVGIEDRASDGFLVITAGVTQHQLRSRPAVHASTGSDSRFRFFFYELWFRANFKFNEREREWWRRRGREIFKCQKTYIGN